MEEVLKALIYASERAANIARSSCTESARETLLVAEKCGGDANSRFDRDFKTIADVLAQESARFEISLRCPDVAKNLRGEECAEINGVTIKLCEIEKSTCELLSTLVPLEAAKKMSEAAHGKLDMNLDSLLSDLNIDLNPGDLGVWIDPIDATAEFIAGVCGEADPDRGLPCVTVLIGAYLRSTGEPVVGVINQPFVNGNKGNIVWGVSYGYIKRWSGGETKHVKNKTILMSAAENPEVIEKFKSKGWDVTSVAGAGHKLLKVALGEAVAYIVSKGTTFRWDTCAPHAILRARGGDIIKYTTLSSISYNDPDNEDTQEYANSSGIIAYSDKNVLDQIRKILN